MVIQMGVNPFKNNVISHSDLPFICSSVSFLLLFYLIIDIILIIISQNNTNV